jgi:hypothetical protein
LFETNGDISPAELEAATTVNTKPSSGSAPQPRLVRTRRGFRIELVLHVDAAPGDMDEGTGTPGLQQADRGDEPVVRYVEAKDDGRPVDVGSTWPKTTDTVGRTPRPPAI